jgi:hypothetical protein
LARDPGRSSDHQEDLVRHRLRTHRSRLRVGAVFVGSDRLLGTYNKDAMRRVLVLGRPVDPNESEEIALTRSVLIAPRIGWKPKFEDAYGMPGDMSWVQRLAAWPPHWLYTPAGLVEGFTTPGFFELNRRLPCPVTALVGCSFLGWLPAPYIDLARVRHGIALDDPYPPVER